jgi:hypothetical protein
MQPAAKPMRTSGLLALATRLLGLTQRELADALGSSLRTAQRWSVGHSEPSDDQLGQLASLVFSRDADLAAQLAARAHTTVAALGLVVPSSPAPLPVAEPARPRPAPEELIDAVVCAAADAKGVTPAEIRPALLAAFARAIKLGLTLEEAGAALGAPRLAADEAKGVDQAGLAGDSLKAPAGRKRAQPGKG